MMRLAFPGSHFGGYICKYTAAGQKVPRSLSTYAHFHTTLKITQKMYKNETLILCLVLLFLYFGNHRRNSTLIYISADHEGFLQ